MAWRGGATAEATQQGRGRKIAAEWARARASKACMRRRIPGRGISSNIAGASAALSIDVCVAPGGMKEINVDTRYCVPLCGLLYDNNLLRNGRINCVLLSAAFHVLMLTYAEARHVAHGVSASIYSVKLVIVRAHRPAARYGHRSRQSLSANMAVWRM